MADYPALPLWTDAYIADTMHMGCLESGAYLHLLMAAWRSPSCTLPDDDKQLGRMARCTPREWQRVSPVVMNFWTLDEKTKTWSQKRLLKEREYVRAKSERAKRAADTKHQKDKESDSANAPAEQVQNDVRPSMPDGCKTDAPIPIPTTDAVDTREPATAFIAIFDNALAGAYGENLRRPWPHQHDLGSAKKWLATGATESLVAAVLTAKMRDLAAKKRMPPKTLSYFDQPIADALAAAAQPMPKGVSDDRLISELPSFLRSKKAPVPKGVIVGSPEWHAEQKRLGLEGEGEAA